ncbi:MAG: hypothetical protein ABIP71_15540, partial [Verrucomicrobiota bacterium]
SNLQKKIHGLNQANAEATLVVPMIFRNQLDLIFLNLGAIKLSSSGWRKKTAHTGGLPHFKDF